MLEHHEGMDEDAAAEVALSLKKLMTAQRFGDDVPPGGWSDVLPCALECHPVNVRRARWRVGVLEGLEWCTV